MRRGPLTAIIRHDWRVLRRDPAFVLIMVAMPLVMMAFLKGTFRLALVADGHPDATGAEQIVPGGIVMFSTFLVGNLGFAVFREHGWATWDRLRATSASTLELVLGKTVIPLFVIALQSVVLFAVGFGVYGLRVSGSPAGLVLVTVAHWICLSAAGLLLLAVCRTVQQLNAISNVGAMVFAGLGGAFTPISTLPSWARRVAPITPHYWSMRGMRATILEGRGVGAVVPSVVVLLAMSAAMLAFARLRFRVDERKLSWA